MSHNYRVVLFCNLKQSSVLHWYRSYKGAKTKYRQLIEKVKPPFCVRGRNRRKTSYYIGIISTEKNDQSKRTPFTKDELGRNVTMDVPAGQTLMLVQPYWVEEKIYDNQTKKHIYLEELMVILDNIRGMKMVYKLNCHIFVENEGKIIFFSLKNKFDSDRLMDILIQYRVSEFGTDCMFSKDVGSYHRRYLYDHLIKAGYSRSKLYRHYSY
jgi:hypothetical protein